MNTVLETRVSQAFGASNLKQCGIYLNRGRIVLLGLLLPLMLILLYTEKFLLMLNQDPSVSKLASSYIINLLPGILMMAMFDANRAFLNALNLTIVPTIVQLIGVPLHFFWAYFFVKY